MRSMGRGFDTSDITGASIDHAAVQRGRKLPISAVLSLDRFVHVYECVAHDAIVEGM